MRCKTRDYAYIKKHLDEYKYTMALVRKDVEETLAKDPSNIFPHDMYERAIQIVFYKNLLDSGEMSIPTRCWECPFHSTQFNTIGQMCDECDLNVNVFSGDLFFASQKKRPKWCPLKEVE